jgi:hypothetical protein
MTGTTTVKQVKRSAKAQTPRSAAVHRTRAVIDKESQNDDLIKECLTEDERWQQDIATLRRAAVELALQRNDTAKFVRKREPDAPLRQSAVSSQEPSTAFRKMSVRDLYHLDPERAVSLFNDALREASAEQRQEIGATLAASGVVDEAIDNLMEGNRENIYSELSLLFLVAKAGKVQPLIRLIEKHPDMHLRIAVVRLLASSGGPEVLSVFRRLAVRRSLAMGVHLALLEAINHISGPTTLPPAWATEPVQHSAAQSLFTG